MIIGVGIDIVYLPRIKKILDRFDDRFYKKVFTERELSKVTVSEIGGKFSSKEAFVKALGTGFRGIRFKDIEVLNDKRGKPFIEINKEVYKRLFDNEKINVHLSISHDGEYANSIVILEKI